MEVNTPSTGPGIPLMNTVLLILYIYIFRYLLNNEQLINKLADSHPIRSAAKFTAYLAQRSKQLAEEGFDKLKESEPVKKVQETRPTDRLNSFKDTFMKEVKEGMKELKGKDKER